MEYGLAQAQLLTNPANPAGALHPNDLGQAAYGDVAGARAQKLTGSGATFGYIGDERTWLVPLRIPRHQSLTILAFLEWVACG